jgi:hypothetical protein
MVTCALTATTHRIRTMGPEITKGGNLFSNQLLKSPLTIYIIGVHYFSLLSYNFLHNNMYIIRL